jgi:hypothetical protein
MVKTFSALRSFRLGRNRPTVHSRQLRFRNFATASLLPAPPATCDYATSSPLPLFYELESIYGNDTLGDCTAASAFYVQDVLCANGGTSFAPTLDQVIAFYSLVGGYVPGNPDTDNGADELTVLSNWKTKGLLADGSHKIAGWMKVDGSNPVECRQALWLFENCLAGDTKIPLLDGTCKTIKQLADDGFDKKVWVYSCDKFGNIVPGLAHSARRTAVEVATVRVLLDSGEEIRCTSEHQFLLRDGSYREAAQLRYGDSLMPLYRRLHAGASMSGYEQILNPATMRWRFTHRAVASNGGRYSGEVVHHKNFEKTDNRPDNLQVMTWADHIALHSKLSEKMQALYYRRGHAASNHKVVSVDLSGATDVYDLTVDQHHNFALASGVFVHNCYFGIELPDAWVSPFPGASGFVWDVAGDSNPDQGHCFMSFGFNENGYRIDTWGMFGLLTNAACAKYATTAGSGELYCVFSQDILNRAMQKSPGGFSWAQLVSAANAMGGNLTVLPSA